MALIRASRALGEPTKMNARIARCSLALTLVGLFLAGGLAAAPLVGMGTLPPLAKPILRVPDAPGPDSSAALALIRDQVYTAAKELGASPDVLAPAMARIAEQGALHQVDMASINDVTATIADYDMAMKLERYLLGYAEAAALGTVVDGTLPAVGLDAAAAAIKKDRLGAIDREPGGGISPRNLGVCKACTDGTIPEPGFGPFTPTPAFQFHSESTDAANDCNWYVFNVVNGTQYQFTTCSPGGAVFDTIIEIYTNPACALITSNDDGTGCVGNPNSFGSDLVWTSNVTGTIKLKLMGPRHL